MIAAGLEDSPFSARIPRQALAAKQMLVIYQIQKSKRVGGPRIYNDSVDILMYNLTTLTTLVLMG